MALVARMFHYGALRRAGGTRRHRYELPEQRLRRALHLAHPIAGGALYRSRAASGTAATAGLAPVQCLELQCAGGACRHLFQGHAYLRANVLPPLLLLPSPPATSEKSVESAHAPELAHEHAEGLGQVHVMEPAEPGLPALEARHAVAVVAGALLRAAEHLVRLGYFLEPLLGALVTRVAVGVVFHGEPPVRLLDVGFGGAAVHAEHVVEISSHGCGILYAARVT